MRRVRGSFCHKAMDRRRLGERTRFVAWSVFAGACCCCLRTVGAGAETAATQEGAHGLLLIDVKVDLAPMGICRTNAAGDGKSDDTAALQSAIDHVAGRGRGTVMLPPGVYRIRSITIADGISLVGAGPEKTFFRGIDDSKVMIELKGGRIMDFTAYGTPAEEASGKNWKVGTEGLGRGSTAKPAHVISVRGAYKGAVISNVRSFEARNDCLYVRGSRGLRVLNCVFDRAGRNVVSMVGNDEDFVFSACRFGSLWGLYHVDIEPGHDRYVRDGLFVDCVFDGSKAGELGTDTWGSFLCFSGHRELKSRNVNVVGCAFENTYVRVRGVFAEVGFL